MDDKHVNLFAVKLLSNRKGANLCLKCTNTLAGMGEAYF